MTVAGVVTDLDNTLFDWVEMWYRSFTALMDALVAETGIPRDVLYDEARAIHQARGTSEYYFLVNDLPSLRRRYPGEDLMRRFAGALAGYCEARDDALRLYPGVAETLAELRGRGVITIGYTESTAFYTGWRVRRLGLDGLLDFLHSPADHALPDGLDRAHFRNHPDEHYRLAHTVHHHTPPGERKPNPRLLLDILADVGLRPDECVYVGDSLMKDVLMAQDAGVADVHAAYGVAQHREAYELLRRVTHWTDADVERERALHARGDVTPTHTLAHGFGELLDRFTFTAARTRAARLG